MAVSSSLDASDIAQLACHTLRETRSIESRQSEDLIGSEQRSDLKAFHCLCRDTLSFSYLKLLPRQLASCFEETDNVQEQRDGRLPPRRAGEQRKDLLRRRVQKGAHSFKAFFPFSSWHVVCSTCSFPFHLRVPRVLERPSQGRLVPNQQRVAHRNAASRLMQHHPPCAVLCAHCDLRGCVIGVVVYEI